MTLSDDAVGSILESELGRAGLHVTNCERHDDVLHVGYESPSLTNSIPREQVGTILRVFLALAGIDTEEREADSIPDAGEWTPDDVEVWAFDDADADADDRETKGHFEVHEGWFHALAAGHLSETDFSTLVLSTLE